MLAIACPQRLPWLLAAWLLAPWVLGQSQKPTLEHQDQADSLLAPGNKRGTFFAFSACGHLIFHPRADGILQVGFPYSASTRRGTSQEVFNSTIAEPFPVQYTAFGLDVQFGDKYHFFELGLGLGRNVDYATIGYGYRAEGNGNPDRRFLIKPSINMGFSEFFAPLGSIDNIGRSIGMFGYVGDSIFVARTGGRTALKERIAKEINVQYRQQSLSINPSVAVEYHPFRNMFAVELSVAYSVPIAEFARITLVQTDGNLAHKNVAKIPLDTGGLSADYNGEPATTSPFSFRGFRLSLKIGVMGSRNGTGW